MAEAQAVPGVVRVITAQDIPGKVYFGQIFQDYAMLALDKIRCEGDVIALVVAEDRDTALRAADLIELEVEELPTLFDSEEALKETNNLIHPSKGSNLINHHKIRRGKASRDTHQEGSTAGIEEALADATLSWSGSTAPPPWSTPIWRWNPPSASSGPTG
jgi:CO/xanthine dehydrogenase Mo-binding subunit